MPNFQNKEHAEKKELWVREGAIDLPVFFPSSNSGAKVTWFYIDFSGCSGDGFMQLKVVDIDRASQSVWWSSKERVLFKFRASVIAGSLMDANLRSEDFVEQMLDRLTFLVGAPVSLMELGFICPSPDLVDTPKG